MKDEKPWIAQYPSSVPSEMSAVGRSLVDAWDTRLMHNPEGKAVAYFDGEITARELENAANALAAALQAMGTARGDRVGIYLQNVPQYAISMLAVWKLGATVLVLNPMYRGQELRGLIDDAEAVGMICLDADVENVSVAIDSSTVRWLVSTSELDYQSRNDPRVFGDTARLDPAEDGDLVELIAKYHGTRPIPVELSGDDLALLTYTSGTTGPPKGAMNTHANVLAVVETFAPWVGLTSGDSVLAIAPLFHITGAVVNAAIALMSDTTLVFVNRFQPGVALEAIAEHNVTFAIASITAYGAILALPQADASYLRSIKALYSGGAPIPPATVERFESKLGIYIHNGYGMTETTSAVIAVPSGVRAPIHSKSGTLSIGVPLPNVIARVVDQAGAVLPPGEEGELVLEGPQVVPGYWNRPEATALTMPRGELRTGDGAIMDEDGWIYLVDRLKDQINVSGYKVWPREVEDVLYEHPSVHEVAVVGQPDEYRGEVVVAHVSFNRGQVATEDELISFVRQRLAAYKSPRRICIVDDLPKTQSGKIRRNVLRDAVDGR